MRNIFFISLLCLCCAACTMPNKEYVIATNAALETIVPSYCTYVEGDKSLKDFDSSARIKASKEALKLSREEMKRIKE